MPAHDWTRVDAGTFHHFHQRWIIAISDAPNASLLPPDYCAMAEQHVDGSIPDVLTLERVESTKAEYAVAASGGGTRTGFAVADDPPRVAFTHETQHDDYAELATRVAVRHVSGDRVVGRIEIVSPGNKSSEMNLRRFNEKIHDGFKRGCHALIVDLHPPTLRDPRGMHASFWKFAFGQERVPGVTPEQPLGMASYRVDLVPTAYFQPFAAGGVLIDMPVFLTPDRYVNLPLETTYQEAWQGVPRRWRDVIEPPTDPTSDE